MGRTGRAPQGKVPVNKNYLRSKSDLADTPAKISSLASVTLLNTIRTGASDHTESSSLEDALFPSNAIKRRARRYSKTAARK